MFLMCFFIFHLQLHREQKDKHNQIITHLRIGIVCIYQIIIQTEVREREVDERKRLVQDGGHHHHQLLLVLYFFQQDIKVKYFFQAKMQMCWAARRHGIHHQINPRPPIWPILALVSTTEEQLPLPRSVWEAR